MDQQSIAINVDGKVSTLADFLEANVDDDAACEWAKSAKPGDIFPAFVECTAVAEQGENERVQSQSPRGLSDLACAE